MIVFSFTYLMVSSHYIEVKRGNLNIYMYLFQLPNYLCTKHLGNQTVEPKDYNFSTVVVLKLL